MLIRALCQVIAGTAVEPHLGAVLAGDHAETVMLDFVQPPSPSGRLLRFVGRQGGTKPAARIRMDQAFVIAGGDG
jgi:hypothetical protein